MKCTWLVAISVLGVPACQRGGIDVSEVVELSELGASVEFGAEEGGSPDAVLHWAMDAVFLGDTVAVLDRSAPFVRYFDRRGAFLGSAVAEGGGPGEARFPIALDRLGGNVIVTERDVISVIEPSGRMRHQFRSTGGAFRGAVACGVRLYLLKAKRIPEFHPKGEIASFPLAVAISEGPDASPVTVLELDTLRASSRVAHPLFAHVYRDTLLIYTEEAHNPRLVAIDCHGNSSQSLPLDSLGRPEWIETMGNGWGLHPPDPPHPAGVARHPLGTIWAVRAVDATGNKVDSVTNVILTSAYTHNAASVALRGWLELVDLDTAGFSLWLKDDEDRGSSVLIIETPALIRAMQRSGISPASGGRRHPSKSGV